MPARSCRVCGGALPKRAVFCPHCGNRVEEEATTTEVIEPPPSETGPVPVEIAVAEPDLFGVMPPMALFALALAALAVGVLLLVLERWVLGAVALGSGLLLAAAFVGVARRKPDGAVARGSARAADRLRERARFARTSLTARARARREVGRLLVERDELRRRRERLVLELGAAVYAGDEAATESLRSEVLELDTTAAAKEEQMQAVSERARAEVDEARLEVQPTEMVEIPGDPGTQPPTIPEPVPQPSPQPGPVPVPEPTPPAIPEPTPVPHEPPTPPAIPEPTPVPPPETEPTTPPQPGA
jgi:hypothetical protein